jgi:hemerythrin-like metal-binding protein
MTLITWGSKLSVGHQQIDDQHKKLVQLVNKLNDAMTAGHGRDAIGPTLTELVKYTQYHFATEERLMKAHGYEHSAEHKAEHEKLLRDVGDFKVRFDAGNSMLSIELLRVLRDWLFGHIAGSDMKLAKCLIAAAH